MTEGKKEEATMSRHYLISDAASELGIHTSTLRRWEKKKFFIPSRDYLGRRVYSAKDIALLKKMLSELRSPEDEQSKCSSSSGGKGD